jgi:hypothetical protein
MSMSRLISSWPVQLRDAATAGDPVHDDGADEIRPSPAEATRQARDADGLVHDFPFAPAAADAIRQVQPLVIGGRTISV